MRGRARAAALAASLVVGGVLMGGCSGSDASPEEAAADTESSRASVEDAVRSVAEVAAGVGLELGPLRGEWSVCTAEPPSLQYGAGGSGRPGGSMADQIAALTDALEADGWTVENAGTEPRAYAVLVRDDLRATLGESRRHPGQVDAGVAGPCVDTTPEQDDLLTETYDIE